MVKVENMMEIEPSAELVAVKTKNLDGLCV
jgi:hypothetical protein